MKVYCAVFVKHEFYELVNSGVVIVEACTNERRRQDLYASNLTGKIYFAGSFYENNPQWPEGCFECMEPEQVCKTRSKAEQWLNENCN